MNSVCIFCEIIDGRQPGSLVYEDHLIAVIMDINPMAEGHCLIMPKQHAQRVHELPEVTRGWLFEMAVRVRCAIDASTLRCDDANYLINDGKHASQEVPHVHVHVIPRCRRDRGKLFRSLLRKAFLRGDRIVDRASLEAIACSIRTELMRQPKQPCPPDSGLQ